MGRPVGSTNLPYLTARKFRDQCNVCHQVYNRGERVIGRKATGYAHEACFEGKYKIPVFLNPDDLTAGWDNTQRMKESYKVKTTKTESMREQAKEKDLPYTEVKIETETESIEEQETMNTEVTRHPEFKMVETTSTSTPSEASVLNPLIQYLMGPLTEQMNRLGDIEAKINKAIAENISDDKLREMVENYGVKRIEIKYESQTEYRELGVQHELFSELLNLCDIRTANGNRINIWVAGPAGSGKTQAAENVAKALELPFYFSGAIAEPYSMLGFKDASGTYQRTAFREAFENGGMFLQDEIDGSEPVALLPFNAALANGHCAFPDKVVSRHPNCLIIAAANTWGHGANGSYVGRNKLDGASLDRYVKLPWHVDEKLELAIAANRDWTLHVQKLRKKVEQKGIKVLVTPRASIYGSLLLAKGFSWSRTEELVIRNGMTDEQWKAVTA